MRLNVFWIGCIIGWLYGATQIKLIPTPSTESVGEWIQDLAAFVLIGLAIGTVFVVIKLAVRLVRVLIRSIQKSARS